MFKLASSRSPLICVSKRWLSESLTNKQKNMMKRGLPTRKSLANVKRIVAIVSGKGGVGKSSIAVGLAISLALNGFNMGLLDTDIFGPSIPRMMGLNGEPSIDASNKMIPLQNFGVHCMSFGFLSRDDSPTCWRGLLVMSAMQNLLFKTAWNNVDLLIIDTPPGTGDVHLSLIQNIVLDGVIVVTAPQRVALEEAKKIAILYQKVDIPIIGIVQNMSAFFCPKCGECSRLSNSGHTYELADELGTSVISEIPFSSVFMESLDVGCPFEILNTDTNLKTSFANMISRISKFGLLNRDSPTSHL